MTYRKKLIEVSLPLEAINAESAREKSIRHGHPSTLHLWWARRPLAACRAVLWSSLVDDPSEYMPDETSANEERERLFAILEQLVKWENVNNEEFLDQARLEIARSVARDLGLDAPVGKTAIRKFLAEQAPPVLDPFAGGGSIPLEAQRLGLRAYASDLNPVAVLINKALIEIPPKFAGMPPVHPPEDVTTESPRGKKGKKAAQGGLWAREWKGAQGLAEDVRYYGKWMRDEAEKRIGHLYPKVKITAEMLAEREDLRKQGLKAGDELTVIAWLWARTVKCPNPACGAQMPLFKTFSLSVKQGKTVWLEPLIDQNCNPPIINFQVKAGNGNPPASPKVGRGAQFKCLACNQLVSSDYIKAEGVAERLNAQLLAIVVEGKNDRLFIGPERNHEKIGLVGHETWKPEYELSQDRRAIWCPIYGINTFDKLFTQRQLATLTCYTDILGAVKNQITKDISRQKGIERSEEYSKALITYLAFAIDKLTTTNSALCTWQTKPTRLVAAFGRQGIPMVWDYAEANPFSSAAGDYSLAVDSLAQVLERLPDSSNTGDVKIADAISSTKLQDYALVSTDPPYYDNIGYADIADYFYVWQRKMLANEYPSLYQTLLTPKAPELIASSYRFDGDREKADFFFESGLRKAFDMIKDVSKRTYPISVFYAFKQSELDENETDVETVPVVKVSTGWEKMLEGLIQSGLQITGTWPMRTELTVALKASVSALASSIVLVCHPREVEESITRREFLSALKRELPPALRQLQLGNIAPVDLAQAAIGPGMAIFSRYKAVLESDGSPMRVRAALALINQALDEYLAEQEGEYDADTRWALAWYEQYGHEAGPYGVAETLSKAKNTSVEGLAHAGFLEARAGKVRLLRRGELEEDWDPAKDKRLTAWEAAQYLIRALDKDGEAGAGALLEKLGAMGETVRDLAYRLYTVCERKGWAQEALAYNMLVVAWPRIKEQAGKRPRQESLL